MAGPNLDVIIGISDKTKSLELSRRISLAGASQGLGIIFGTPLIRRLYPTEGQMLDNLSNEVSNPIVFTVTSNPLATDAQELFQQFNPWTGANPTHAGLFSFLELLWSFGGISQVIVVIWESMIPSSQHMPRYEMNTDQFRKWLVEYNRKELAPKGDNGGQGIFNIKV